MRFGSLFAGIEGFGLGLSRAGMEYVFQVEKDRHATQVLEHRFPDVTRFADVSEFDAKSIAVRPDLICGGFPCQDLSVAGKRAGLAGKRSGLFHQFMRIVSEFSPRWVLIENVPGLLSSNEGRDMGAVVGALADMGYGWAYRVLDSQWFGMAQRRQRVFIVGCAGNGRRAAEVLFDPESLPWDSAPSRQAREGVAGTLESRAGSGFPGTDEASDGHVVAASLNAHHGRTDGESETFSAGPITTKAHADNESQESKLIVAYQCHEISGGGDGSNDFGRHREEWLIVFDERNVTSKANRSTVEPGRVCHTLHSSPPTVAYNIPCVAFQESQSGFRERETHATLDSNNGSRRHQGVMASTVVRRLTPRECERLQGFPDDWMRYGTEKGKAIELSDSARYRLLGNAVSVPVAQWIGERIMRGEPDTGGE